MRKIEDVIFPLAVCDFERCADRVCVEDPVPLDDPLDEAERDGDPLLVFDTLALDVGVLVK